MIVFPEGVILADNSNEIIIFDSRQKLRHTKRAGGYLSTFNPMKLGFLMN